MAAPQLPGIPPVTPPAKRALRDQLLARRRDLAVLDLGSAARALAEQLLALPEVRRTARVAAYVSVGAEPSTSFLLDPLAARGSVLLPVVREDLDLDWATYRGEDSLAPAARGLREPTTPRLGVGAVAGADVVLVPGLACSAAGDRLGRGGGSYDRALARVPVGTPVVCLLHDGELDQPVPTEPHDRRVTAAVTPSRVVRF